MGLPSRQPFHARHSHGPRGRNDPRKPRSLARAGRSWVGHGLIAALLSFLAFAAQAETLKIATYNADLSAKGPGLLLQQLSQGGTDQQKAVVSTISALDADVILLTGIDFDLRDEAVSKLADLLAAAGSNYPHRLALRPNRGIPTGLDLDGDGQFAEPEDAMAFGRFPGQDGMALLSRLPISREGIRDFSGFRWSDLPGTLMPAGDPGRDGQRLSSGGHYDVPVILADGSLLHLLVWHATPPVFDGPEDRNGRRNHDEAAFWARLLDGSLEVPPPAPPFVLLGQANLDPSDGEGLPQALRGLTSLPGLQDPLPRGSHSRSDRGHAGDPLLDTALYDGIGGLRVDVVLPSSGLKVLSSGVLWPPDHDALAETINRASRHRPVWVELSLP